MRSGGRSAGRKFRSRIPASVECVDRDAVSGSGAPNPPVPCRS